MLERSDEMAGPLFIRRILTEKAIIIIFVNASFHLQFNVWFIRM